MTYETRKSHLHRNGRYKRPLPLPVPEDEEKQPTPVNEENQPDDVAHEPGDARDDLSRLILSEGAKNTQMQYESMSDHSDDDEPNDYAQPPEAQGDVMQQLAMDLLGLTTNGHASQTDVTNVLRCVQARLGFRLGPYHLPKSFPTLVRLANLPDYNSTCTWPICTCRNFAFAPEVTECIECHARRPLTLSLSSEDFIVVFDYKKHFK